MTPKDLAELYLVAMNIKYLITEEKDTSDLKIIYVDGFYHLHHKFNEIGYVIIKTGEELWDLY